MNTQERSTEYRNDPYPDETRPRRPLWVLIPILLLAALAFCAFSARATEYSFAPATNATFKRDVRAMLERRTGEVWKEVAPVKFWLSGPLTFQSVNGGNALPLNLKGFSQPGVEAEIDRGLFAVTWLYRGTRDFICYNRAAGSSHAQTIADLNTTLTYWETHDQK